MRANEKALIAKLLDMAADTYSNHGCNDLDTEEFFGEFTPADRAKLLHEMQEFNGDKEDPSPTKLIHIGDYALMRFYAHKIRAS